MRHCATASTTAPAPATRDHDLRTAVLAEIMDTHGSALVVEELGLQHGTRRIDIAVIADRLHGYELKSQADRLDRLPGQVAAYSLVMDRATLVTAENHLAAALKCLPDWWGVQLAVRDGHGTVRLESVRPGADNPAPDPFHVAQLLWRPEAVELVEALGTGRDLRRLNKATLYSILVTHLAPEVIREHVCAKLHARTEWRKPKVAPGTAAPATDVPEAGSEDFLNASL